MGEQARPPSCHCPGAGGSPSEGSHGVWGHTPKGLPAHGAGSWCPGGGRRPPSQPSRPGALLHLRPCAHHAAAARRLQGWTTNPQRGPRDRPQSQGLLPAGAPARAAAGSAPGSALPARPPSSGLCAPSPAAEAPNASCPARTCLASPPAGATEQQVSRPGPRCADSAPAAPASPGRRRPLKPLDARLGVRHLDAWTRAAAGDRALPGHGAPPRRSGGL